MCVLLDEIDPAVIKSSRISQNVINLSAVTYYQLAIAQQYVNQWLIRKSLNVCTVVRLLFKVNNATVAIEFFFRPMPLPSFLFCRFFLFSSYIHIVGNGLCNPPCIDYPSREGELAGWQGSLFASNIRRFFSLLFYCMKMYVCEKVNVCGKYCMQIDNNKVFFMLQSTFFFKDFGCLKK